MQLHAYQRQAAIATSQQKWQKTSLDLIRLCGHIGSRDSSIIAWVNPLFTGHNTEQTASDNSYAFVAFWTGKRSVLTGQTRTSNYLLHSAYHHSSGQSCAGKQAASLGPKRMPVDLPKAKIYRSRHVFDSSSNMEPRLPGHHCHHSHTTGKS
jgi:hypothetical protein